MVEKARGFAKKKGDAQALAIALYEKALLLCDDGPSYKAISREYIDCCLAAGKKDAVRAHAAEAQASPLLSASDKKWYQVITRTIGA